ncbi:MAG: hypothetical protein OXC65_14990 [Thiotrichales bacterium]|nr:hypothetical protein [Thiotrichales bacterium]
MTKRTVEIAVKGLDAHGARVAAYRMRVPLKEGFGLRACQRLNRENPGIVHLYRIGWGIGDSLPRNQNFFEREGNGS